MHVRAKGSSTPQTLFTKKAMLMQCCTIEHEVISTFPAIEHTWKGYATFITYYEDHGQYYGLPTYLQLEKKIASF